MCRELRDAHDALVLAVTQTRGEDAGSAYLVWGFGEADDTYLVKAHIRHLREKIEAVPGKPKFIVTTPGVGYMLKRPVSEAGLAVEGGYERDESPARVLAIPALVK
jgi:DNA-binding winged helix-turn-helix (wHTH) protein